MEPRPNPAPLTARELWREVVDELFSLDRGLPYTFVSLWRAPGATVRRYVVERDPRITKPVRYFLVAAGVMTATMLALRGHFEALGRLPTSGREAAIADFAIEHLLLVNAIGVLCGALALKLVFLRRGTTFGETLAIAACSAAQAMWLNAAFAGALVLAARDWVSYAGGAIMLAYNLWFWASYFGGRLREWGLALIALLLGQSVLTGTGYVVVKVMGLTD